MSFQRILVAIDNSSLSHRVFAQALELAHFHQSLLKLLQCIAPEIVSEPGTPGSLDTGFPMGLVHDNYQAYETQQVLIEQQIEEAQATLTHYSEQAKSHNVLVEASYQVGDAGHQLCQVAKDWGADLIVVGRRGRTGLTEALLGSVSNYVVHHAPCDVLVIQDIEEVSPQPTTVDLSTVMIDPPLSPKRA
jgi:nucleotide-binding universal stress UspA family protein